MMWNPPLPSGLGSLDGMISGAADMESTVTVRIDCHAHYPPEAYRQAGYEAFRLAMPDTPAS